MPIKADMKYEAEIVDAFLVESKTQKTPAIYFLFDTPDGQIDHNLYITARTVERARETMQDCFHLSPEEVSSMAESGDWSPVIGSKVSITTIAEDYQGTQVVKVQWMNPAKFKPQKAPTSTAKAVAGLFSGGPVSSPAYRSEGGAPEANWGPSAVTSDDVPFSEDHRMFI